MTMETRRLVRSALLSGVLAVCVALLSLGTASAQQIAHVASLPGGADELTRSPRPDVASRPLGAVVDGGRVVPAAAAVMRREAAEQGPSVVEAVVLALATRVPSEREPDLGSLDDFLPEPLCRDLLRLRSQVQDARKVLFGRRGIVRLGSQPDGEGSRLRLNLQYSPDPGIRFTLVTP